MKIYFLLFKALGSLKRLIDPATYSNPYIADDLPSRSQRGFTTGKRNSGFSRRWAIR